MNVEPHRWTGQVPNPQQPLSAGLRAAFGADLQLPVDMRRLLSLLDRPVAVR